MIVKKMPWVLLALSFGLGSALAQGTAEQREACTGDAFKFCGAFIPDEKKIEQCLAENLRELSPACRAVFVQERGRQRAPGTRDDTPSPR